MPFFYLCNNSILRDRTKFIEFQTFLNLLKKKFGNEDSRKWDWWNISAFSNTEKSKLFISRRKTFAKKVSGFKISFKKTSSFKISMSDNDVEEPGPSSRNEGQELV